MTSSKVQSLIAAVNDQLRINREAAYRRALKAAGYLPQSIDVMVKRDRDWIDNGR